MSDRLKTHPILDIIAKEEVSFYWNKVRLSAIKDETLSAALIANGVNIFGYHHKDSKAQGIYCANGQCAKCMVIANGFPVKACMTKVSENMFVESANGLPILPNQDNILEFTPIRSQEIDVLIIGGGPSGLSAAIELDKNNISTILVDDKNELGGKLVLQTHKFFGSVADSFAGKRGIDIGKTLSQRVSDSQNITVWKNATALYVFKDKKVGILKENEYVLVEPKLIINAAGAREKFLRFSGNDLVGIYGAGAFQTLVNRDLVKSSKRLFIVGGGNVGLIAGYHALQAGIVVVGLVESMPSCGGYKVHADKLKRLGVPIYTSHTILSANGKEVVDSITIAEIDKDFRTIKGTEKSFACDTILVAVGLDPLKEFTEEAEMAGLKVFSTGDAFEIAEASSAMFNGKITGMLVSKELGASAAEVPEIWYQKAEMLKSHPGAIMPSGLSDAIGAYPPRLESIKTGAIMPVIHCIQEIPCNPCTSVCPTKSIYLEKDSNDITQCRDIHTEICTNGSKENAVFSIMGLPVYHGSCIGCGKCINICPGLAISLVDLRHCGEQGMPTVSLPYEILNQNISRGDDIDVVDIDGISLGVYKVVDIVANQQSKTQQIKVRMPIESAVKAISFKVQSAEDTKPLDNPVLPETLDDNTMICLCEKVSVATVKSFIDKGITDINQLKAVTRICMGPCGAKTCDFLLRQVFRQQGIPLNTVISNTKRPLFVEVPLEKFVLK